MPVRDEVIAPEYALYHSDCMEVLPGLPAESVGLSVYSPPFPELYQYSDDPRDMCNCVSYAEAIEQYRYVVREVARLTKPGRMSCVHVTDLKRGVMYQHDFPGDVVRVHEGEGLHYFCRVTIWKDAWEFARRTRMKTLMHKTLTLDSASSRLAPADYLLVFKKAGVNPEPITHPDGFSVYAGENQPTAELAREFAGYKGDQRKNALSHWIYRQYASPVWMDIRRGRTLPHRGTKENPEERHVCPLQLDVIERCLALWSNPGDTVLTPFMGIGSEAYCAVRHGRRAIGCELKGTYFRQAAINVKIAAEAGPLDDWKADAAADEETPPEEVADMPPADEPPPHEDAPPPPDGPTPEEVLDAVTAAAKLAPARGGAMEVDRVRCEYRVITTTLGVAMACGTSCRAFGSSQPWTLHPTEGEALEAAKDAIEDRLREMDGKDGPGARALLGWLDGCTVDGPPESMRASRQGRKRAPKGGDDAAA